MTSLMVALGALIFLMLAAYRGFSVIIAAPLAAIAAILLTEPSAVPAVFSGLFMDKMVGFLKLYLPVFLLGAIFGKLVEISGFARSIVSGLVTLVGADRAMLAVVLVSTLMTYGGVSLFVAVFAVYPFAAEMFRRADIPKRLIPATIGLGAFSFTMDSLPGSPQIQNIIPTTFFGTTAWAAPILGLVGALFTFASGMAYLEWARKRAKSRDEGYGEGHSNEPAPAPEALTAAAHPLVALIPLALVGLSNLALTHAIPLLYPPTLTTSLPGLPAPLTTNLQAVTAIWAVEGALAVGILSLFLLSFRTVVREVGVGTKAAVAGALLAAVNTASEYGFGAVIAALPGFLVVRDALSAVPNPLINEAVSITALAGITGSASGGMSIALAALSEQFIAAAHGAGIPLEVLHRVASMASGGMDTLPHNGAVITVLAVTGLTHKQSYGPIFAITAIKTAAVFVVIATYYLTGIV
uniref:Citrate transporter n=1 Tax=Caulobacter sp. (strain K31) TaxID=366602 RepID=B0T7H8_CAUSK